MVHFTSSSELCVFKDEHWHILMPFELPSHRVHFPPVFVGRIEDVIGDQLRRNSEKFKTSFAVFFVGPHPTRKRMPVVPKFLLVRRAQSQYGTQVISNVLASRRSGIFQGCHDLFYCFNLGFISSEAQRDGMSVFFTQRPSSFETLFMRLVKRTSSASQASDCA